MRPILHRHYCRVYRAVNLPWTRLILTRAAHQIIRPRDVAFVVRGGGGVFHAMGTAASRTEKHKRLDLPLRCSLLVTRDQMSAAIEIQRATSSIVTAIELLRTTLSTCPMRERKKLGQSWFNRPMIDLFPSNFVEKTLKISPKFPS